MQEKFTVPKTLEDFKKQADERTVRGSEAVIMGLNVKLKKVAEPLKQEIKFHEDVIQYKKTGAIPERFNNE